MLANAAAPAILAVAPHPAMLANAAAPAILAFAPLPAMLANAAAPAILAGAPPVAMLANATAPARSLARSLMFIARACWPRVYINMLIWSFIYMICA